MQDLNKLLSMLVNQQENNKVSSTSLNQNKNQHCCILSLPPQQFTALATIIGFLLACKLTVDEQNSFGSFLFSIGQTLSTISAQASTLQSEHNNNSAYDQLQLLKKQIESLEKQLK